MQADDVLGVERGDASRDHRAPVATLRAVTLVPEPRHQRGPRFGDALHVPSRRGSGARPPVTGQRRDHDMERRAQRLDHVEELRHRTGPAVRHEQRRRVGVVGAGVDEVDLLAVDLGERVRPPVEAILLRPPVELRAPVLAQLLQVRAVGAVAPTRIGDLVGPAGACESVAQVFEVRFGNVDAERGDRVGAHRAKTTAAVQGAAAGRPAGTVRRRPYGGGLDGRPVRKAASGEEGGGYPTAPRRGGAPTAHCGAP